MKHQLALDRLSMTYSWYNIRSDYGNNKIKYTHDGTNWQTITFVDGMYSYRDLNDYIHQYMDQKSHHSTDSSGKKTYSIKAYSTLRNETKRNEMVLCETVLCEMVLCETVLCEMVLCETVLCETVTTQCFITPYLEHLEFH